MDFVRLKMVEWGVDISRMDMRDPVTSLSGAHREVGIKQGIDTDAATRMATKS
jgi:hypothetical protein